MKSENEKDENMQRKETNKREGKNKRKRNQPNDKILFTAMNMHDGNTTRLLWHENMKIKKKNKQRKIFSTK